MCHTRIMRYVQSVTFRSLRSTLMFNFFTQVYASVWRKGSIVLNKNDQYAFQSVHFLCVKVVNHMVNLHKRKSSLYYACRGELKLVDYFWYSASAFCRRAMSAFNSILAVYYTDRASSSWSWSGRGKKQSDVLFSHNRNRFGSVPKETLEKCKRRKGHTIQYRFSRRKKSRSTGHYLQSSQMEIAL